MILGDMSFFGKENPCETNAKIIFITACVKRWMGNILHQSLLLENPTQPPKPETQPKTGEEGEGVGQEPVVSHSEKQ